MQEPCTMQGGASTAGIRAGKVGALSEDALVCVAKKPCLEDAHGAATNTPAIASWWVEGAAAAV